jgi:uncharacterized protein (TIGR03435 family)
MNEFSPSADLRQDLTRRRRGAKPGFLGRTFFLALLVALPLAAQTAPPMPAFAVASIRPNTNATDGGHHIYNDPENAEFRTVNVSALALLNFAYNIPITQILDAPAWAKTTMWDVTAKADPSTDEQLRKLPHEESRATKRKMVQALLAERFGLKAHLETQELPEYALVVLKTGSKLTESRSNGLSIGLGRAHLSAQGITAPLLCEQLAQIIEQPVVDETALPGRYDVALRWTPDDAPPPAPNTDAAPSFFTAVQEQLGLKLQSKKGPVQVLVLDQLTQPTAN